MGTGAIDRNRQFCGAVAVFDFLQRKPKNSKNAGVFEKKQVILIKKFSSFHMNRFKKNPS